MEKEVCVPFPVHWNGMVGAFAEKTADPFRIPWLIKIGRMEEAIRQDQFNCVRFSWQIKFVHERESVAASGLVDTRERRYCIVIRQD
jgi:hypothetical protein